jgi:hypothetical protein
MYSQKQIKVEPKPVEEDACVQINQHARRRLIGGGSVEEAWFGRGWTLSRECTFSKKEYCCVFVFWLVAVSIVTTLEQFEED